MNFHIQDIFALDFTQLNQDECLRVLSFRNHPEISKWMYSKNISLPSHLRFIKELKTNTTSYYWLFKKNQTLLGVGSITRINLVHKHGYLGIYKNPELSLAGSEILKSLEYIAFKNFNLHTLHLEVMQNNQKAIKFYEKYNYICGGKLSDFIYQDNTYQDVLVYTKRNPYE